MLFLILQHGYVTEHIYYDPEMVFRENPYLFQMKLLLAIATVQRYWSFNWPLWYRDTWYLSVHYSFMTNVVITLYHKKCGYSKRSNDVTKCCDYLSRGHIAASLHNVILSRNIYIWWKYHTTWICCDNLSPHVFSLGYIISLALSHYIEMWWLYMYITLYTTYYNI